MIYATITVVAGAMALWLHTKWGKKFLEVPVIWVCYFSVE